MCSIVFPIATIHKLLVAFLQIVETSETEIRFELSQYEHKFDSMFIHLVNFCSDQVMAINAVGYIIIRTALIVPRHTSQLSRTTFFQENI